MRSFLAGATIAIVAAASVGLTQGPAGTSSIEDAFVSADAGGVLLYLSDGGSNLFSVDVATGTLDFIGAMSQGMDDLAVSSSGQLYGVSWRAGGPNHAFEYFLYAINTSTAAITEIGATGVAEFAKLNSLVFSPGGTLYAASEVGSGALPGGNLYSLNPLTGAATTLGNINSPGATCFTTASGLGCRPEGDLAFHAGQLYMASQLPGGFQQTSGGLTLVNLVPAVRGDAVGLFGFPYDPATFAPTMEGLASAGNVLYGASAGSTKGIYTIDPGTGQATLLWNFTSDARVIVGFHGAAAGLPVDPCVINTLETLEVAASPSRGTGRGMRLDSAAFRRLRDRVLVRSPAGRRYARLYAEHSPEVVRLMLADSTLRAAILNGLLLSQDSVAALADGRGASVVLTDEQTRAVDIVVDRLVQVGSVRLRQAIETERRTRPPGLSLAQAALREIGR